MSTITREQLRERAREKVISLEFAVTQTAFADSRADLEEELELARIALASLEAEKNAEPVAKVETVGVCWYADNGVPRKPAVGTELYAATPAPVSVPDALEDDIHSDDHPLLWSYNNGWNACRAAMLQGAENAGSPTTMKTAPAMDSSPKIAEATSGNSPVIPDGWVACSERMPDNRGKSRELYVCWGTYFDGAEPDYIPALFFIHPTNGWCEWEPLEDDCDQKKVVITHWMPMPAAPLQEAE
ncbi:DUF551 domain-containing protein [Enterobacter roggenkampii]|uniref:DUF551 domain-containing protein n=1 Tax=Enterobacter roggenkampii TaxID=1812935 RepID=UPI0021D2771B|nr:DUF551 domain-containing protein [Enterobacter roggenkampii]MCU6180759.1 DUF551 domain-containing protein [Enterobacter roggenkampii]